MKNLWPLALVGFLFLCTTIWVQYEHYQGLKRRLGHSLDMEDSLMHAFCNADKIYYKDDMECVDRDDGYFCTSCNGIKMGAIPGTGERDEY